MATKKKKESAPKYPMFVETFQLPGDWELRRMADSNPSCFNGIVSVVKYKISVEKVEEPIEAIWERLEYLWVTSDNHHHYRPLETEAKEYGYTFKGDFGSQRHKKS
jgi:hypothetical protein